MGDEGQGAVWVLVEMPVLEKAMEKKSNYKEVEENCKIDPGNMQLSLNEKLCVHTRSV